ncbi:MAG: 9-O-acetylesterase [Muribaculaceae bacterium]|nr:9-O-acetylesterase [Muribaculaceae bacterium]
MKRAVALLTIVAAGLSVCGKVLLPQFFTDNMIVQRNAVLTVPGNARPGSTVTVKTDWGDGVKVSGKADKDGRFRIEVPTPEAGGPFTVIVSDGSKDGDVVLSNVLSGEVWLCSGQSNMEFPVKGWSAVMNADEVVARSQHPDIRLLQVKKNLAYTPQDDAEVNMGGWVEASPATMDFSAIAYLFALQMQQELGVPVGVIDSTWGGTPAEAWTGYEALVGIDGFEGALDDLKKSGFSREELFAVSQRRADEWTERVTAIDLDFDRSEMQAGWEKMPVPGEWEKSVLPGFDGVVWLQREVELPAEAAGMPLRLNLAKIDNMDDTYFNGTRVGGFDNYAASRSYEVPGNLVKGGKNVISVRVIDFDGGGGIYGDASEMAVVTGGKSYPLAGEWSYKIAGDLKQLPAKPASPQTSQYPTTLYNAMIHPISVMPVKGVLWYQGCANVGRDSQYEPLFQALINNWRSLYGNDEMPFYFVQLAGWLRPQNVQPDSEWAALRNAQSKALCLPNTAMAVAIDLGHPEDIHPVDKQEVARRLGLIALNRDYGKRDVVYAAPRCVRSESRGDKMVLKFDGPLHSASGVATGFIIGDGKGKFAYAKSVMKGDDTIELSSPLIERPSVARYNWADYPGGNLYGPTGLPVAPFATDK